MKPAFPIPEPQVVWNHFLDLVAVPRPSKEEGAAVDFIENWARRLGFTSKRDEVNNICVHVPATSPNPAEPILLQCHLDIVPVTDAPDGVDADASAGKIPLERGDFNTKCEKKLIPNPAGDWVNAPYTTLGADNGMGVAMMMALAEKPERRVPLQLLFTVDEEAGMTGAIGIEPEKLGITSTTMINIDTEEDDEITVGSAGGRDAEVQWKGAWEVPTKPSGSAGLSQLRLKLHGLKGGHSGIEINQGRGNANRLLARILYAIGAEHEYGLIAWEGGSRRNAIPDSSTASIVVANEKISSIKKVIDRVVKSFDRLYQNRDNAVEVFMDESKFGGGKALTRESSLTFVRLVQSIPTGICEMTPELPVLVESSCNMAIIELGEGAPAKIVCSVRGTTPEALTDVSETIAAVASLAGGDTKTGDGYPGWKPDLESTLLQTAIGAYEKLHGEKPKVHAVHAGLECGLLAERIPGLKAISMGPTIKGNHAAGERVSISSVAKSYRFLEGILEELP